MTCVYFTLSNILSNVVLARTEVYTSQSARTNKIIKLNHLGITMKYIKKISKVVLLIIMLGSLFFPADLFTQPEADLSPQEMQELDQLEQELLEASQAIDEYVSTLSPEEQAEFNRAVEEVSEMIENMSEEELNQFLGEMFAGEPAVEPEVEVEKPEEPVVEEEPAVEQEPELTVEQQRKIENAINLIDLIIKYTNTFIIKVQSSPDLPAKIVRWGKKGTIKEWPTDLTWKDFKTNMETFVQKLYKMKDQDPRTKEYKYMGGLLEDETLFNNVAQLQAKLKKEVPQIEIPEFGLQKLSRKSKQATQKATSSYTEALYTLKIPESLDQLFEKFEPKAEKLRKEEEAAEKRAVQEAKKPRRPTRAVEAGVSPEEALGYGYGPSYDYDYGFEPPTFEPTYGRRYPSDTERPRDRRKPTERKPTPPTAAADKAKKEIEDLARRAQVPKNPESERLLGAIIQNLKDLVETIDKQPRLKNLTEHLTNDKEPVDTALVIDINQLKRKISKTEDNVKALQLKTRRLSQTLNDYYRDELKSVMSKDKKVLENLAKSIKDINYQQTKGQILPEKQWAYFKDEEAQPTDSVKATRKQIPTPTTLPELQESIDKLMKTVKTKEKKEKTKTPVTRLRR